ncbi:hypothetical protein BJ878DRAFT_534531 [Calycina marina]|uniref:Uncharacterized protein n=1 Tax=Calycina marina TaxID=1763456 RepID=A0A9P7Z401_9HELO|nr:hypothetical protein BJ878DRAFT_534531 [Calycina marina]
MSIETTNTPKRIFNSVASLAWNHATICLNKALYYNHSPSKLSRLTQKSPIDREPTSPLKMLKSRTSPSVNVAQSVPAAQSPRKFSSPEKRFPVKPSLLEKRPAVEEKGMDQTVTIQDVLRDNEGLTKAIQILEECDSDLQDEQENTTCTMGGSRHDETRNMDDTMVSTFSAFSAVPDMTMFAKIGHSPTKYASMGPSPRRNDATTPPTSRRQRNNVSPSPTPRSHRYDHSRDEGNTTNLILDFTEQINGFSGRAINSPTKQARRSPMKGSSTIPEIGRCNTVTPSSNRMSNLLDFDIPPAPTPRSMPSITPRELESLKSGFLSEISSLRASLSGKDAEVQSLKTAVGDAEKRVGESMEQVREERNLKDQLAAEKEEWEKRGREMEAVLRNVKEEIVNGERDRDDLEARLEESEKRREAADIMAQEAQSKLAAMRANKSPSPSEAGEGKSGECVCGGRAVEVAVEKVSRELHTLYREKHETKVAKLKKSYEHRWEKRIRELEDKLEDLTKENEMLKRDTTMTKIQPRSSLEVIENLEKHAAKDAKAKELEAELKGLSETVKSVKRSNADLRTQLEEERLEKGNLVSAVDEMWPLIAEYEEKLANMNSRPEMPTPKSAPASQLLQNGVDNLRGSVSRASGLRAPGTNGASLSLESRIGRGGFSAPAVSSNLDRTRSGSSQGSRPGSGLGYRSGIMGSIEKMGSYKGRAEKALDG